MLEPREMPRHIRLRRAEIGDAGLAEAGLGLDHRVHALPQLEAFDDQRDLARVAHHLAAPAPIAARLLAGDVALLAQDGRDALLREEQGRARPDDAAADDDDIGAGRKSLVGCDRIDARRHGSPPGIAEYCAIL